MSTSRRGRPKGSRNRITNEAKQAILMAFDQLGGVKRLVEWVKKDDANETIYWTKIFPMLLPRPAAEATEPPEALAPVKGALVWDKPTPSPYRPLVASAAASALAAAVTDGLALPSPEALAAGLPP